MDHLTKIMRKGKCGRIEARLEFRLHVCKTILKNVLVESGPMLAVKSIKGKGGTYDWAFSMTGKKSL